MFRVRWCFYSFIFLLGAAGIAYADSIDPLLVNCTSDDPVLQLTGEPHGILIGQCMEMLEDRTGSLSIEAIQSAEWQHAFKKSSQSTPTMSFSGSVFWAKFTIENYSSSSISLYLEHSFALTDYITLYSPAPSGGFLEETLGDKVAYTKRVIPNRFPVFSMQIPPGKSTYYVRYDDTTGASLLPLWLWSPAAFMNHTKNDYGLLNLLSGIVISMLLFNLYIAISMRSRTYVFYVIYTVCFLIVQLIFQGISVENIPTGPFLFFLQERGLVVVVNCCFIFGCAFAIFFLHTRDRQPMAHRYLQASIGAHILVAILALFFDIRIISTLANGLTVITALAMITIGVISFAKKYTPAFFYVAGWSFLLLGTIGTALKYQGVIGSNFYSEWGMSLGGALEAILISIALGSRLNFIRRKAEGQIKDLNTQLQHSLTEVEKIVEERTFVISTIINNVKSGFLLINQQLQIKDGFTKSCHILFGENIQINRSLPDLLGLSGRDLDHFEAAIDQAFRDEMPELVSLAQIPQDFKIKDKTLSMEAAVIRDKTGQIEGLLFTVIDSTKLIAKETEADINQMLLRILHYRGAFSQFIRLTHQSLKRCRSGLEIYRDFNFRQIFHTIKGNCALYGLKHLTMLIHKMEDKEKITITDIDLIEEEFRSLLGRYVEIIELSWDQEFDRTYAIKTSQMYKLKHIMATSHSLEQQTEAVRGWAVDAMAEPAIRYLGPIEEMVQRIAVNLGKKIYFKLQGESTQLNFPFCDRVLENLIHLIRNAIDHGIENNRIAAGKDEYGDVQLIIDRNDKETTITITDDGQGIDAAKLVEKAVAGKKVANEDLVNLNDSDKIIYILSKGISTKGSVTEISGRGLGFPAFLESVDKAGGKVTVQTQKGSGCRFLIAIPSS